MNEEYDVNQLGFQVGSVVAMNSQRSRKRKHPLGFAPPAKTRKRSSGGRPAGSWPVVPPFDIRPT